MHTFIEMVQDIITSFTREDNKILSAIEDNIELTSTATLPHAVGTYLVLDKVVYKVTTVIATGDTIEEGVNVTVADDIMTMIEALETENQTLTNRVNDIVNVYGSKNLLPYPYPAGYSTTINGVTFTVNDDGSVTANGTATSDARLYIHTSGYIYLKDFDKTKKYILNGCPNGGSSSAYSLQFLGRNTDATSWATLKRDYGNGVEIDNQDYDLYAARIQINGGQTVSNLTFYPMLRLASIEDDTYEPYAKTNQQLTEDSVDWDDYSEVGAVNMLDFTKSSQVAKGYTFTNTDGVVTVTGSRASGETGNADYYVNITLPKGTYKVSGCPSGGSDDTWRLLVNINDGAKYAFDYGDGAVFTLTEESTLRVYCSIMANYSDTVNLTFKPMITLSSYNGDYVPYAKSNKELTEDVAEMVRGGAYVYPLKNNFNHIAITASKGPGQYVKLITTSDEINALTSSSAFNTNLMNQQKVIRNNSNASSTWTYSIDGLTLNLNCTSQVVGCIISNYPLTFTTEGTSTPEANTMDVLNLALLSNS